MNQIYRARAPLRLGLAGGGTDVSPFSEEQGGYVLNATVDLYAQAILEPRTDGHIVFAAADREETVELNSTAELSDIDPLRLHRGIYNRIVRQFHGGQPLSFKLTTFVDAPAGSGLGTSSTMVVCIIQAFSEWLNLGLGEYEIAHLAYALMATSNSPTRGHPKFPQAARSDYDASAWTAKRAAASLSL
jgi:D-glycero-alpha-D-manno-heptose-7-phosphate kinase